MTDSKFIHLTINDPVLSLFWLSNIPYMEYREYIFYIYIYICIYVHIHIYTIFFIHSSVDAHLGCFVSEPILAGGAESQE